LAIKLGPGFAQELINAGADVNAVTYRGFTPLMLAAEKGDAITTALLIAAGANVNARHSGQIRYGPHVLRGKCLKPAFTSDMHNALGEKAVLPKNLHETGQEAIQSLMKAHQNLTVLEFALINSPSIDVLAALMDAGAVTRPEETEVLFLARYASRARHLEIMKWLLGVRGVAIHGPDLAVAAEGATYDPIAWWEKAAFEKAAFRMRWCTVKESILRIMVEHVIDDDAVVKRALLCALNLHPDENCDREEKRRICRMLREVEGEVKGKVRKCKVAKVGKQRGGATSCKR
jgi:hypothetical protein